MCPLCRFLMKMLDNFSSTQNPWGTMLVMSLMLSQQSLSFGPSGLAPSSTHSVCSALHPQLQNGNAMGDGVKILTGVNMCYSHCTFIICLIDHLVVEGNEVDQVWCACEIPRWVVLHVLGNRFREVVLWDFSWLEVKPSGLGHLGPTAHLFLSLALW